MPDSFQLNPEDVMTDYRDPPYRDPNYRDPSLPPGAEPWSNSTWGWIAGAAVAILVAVFFFSSGRREAPAPAKTGEVTFSTQVG